MSPQAYALRPVHLSDLPTLKRWRSLPDIQRHLRHPYLSWWGHLRWWWSLQSDLTKRVWAVTLDGVLVGQVGLYYRMGPTAEVSVLMVFGAWEDYAAEEWVIATLLTDKAREWGLTTLYAEVLATAPLHRHTIFPGPALWADTYSTLYRWSIG